MFYLAVFKLQIIIESHCFLQLVKLSYGLMMTIIPTTAKIS